MRTILFWVCSLLFLSQPVLGQPDRAIAIQDSIWAKNYQKRIKKAKLYGIYIPQNMGDAHLRLSRLISPEAKQKFDMMTEEQVAHKLFFSLGRWIILNWGLEDGSRLSHDLRKLGLTHPEDMAQFLMITYHRKRQHLPFNAKSLIHKLVKARKEEWQKRHKVITIPATN